MVLDSLSALTVVLSPQTANQDDPVLPATESAVVISTATAGEAFGVVREHIAARYSTLDGEAVEIGSLRFRGGDEDEREERGSKLRHQPITTAKLLADLLEKVWRPERPLRLVAQLHECLATIERHIEESVDVAQSPPTPPPDATPVNAADRAAAARADAMLRMKARLSALESLWELSMRSENWQKLDEFDAIKHLGTALQAPIVFPAPVKVNSDAHESVASASGEDATADAHTRELASVAADAAAAGCATIHTLWVSQKPSGHHVSHSRDFREQLIEHVLSPALLLLPSLRVRAEHCSPAAAARCHDHALGALLAIAASSQHLHTLCTDECVTALLNLAALTPPPLAAKPGAADALADERAQVTARRVSAIEVLCNLLPGLDDGARAAAHAAGAVERALLPLLDLSGTDGIDGATDEQRERAGACAACVLAWLAKSSASATRLRTSPTQCTLIGAIKGALPGVPAPRHRISRAKGVAAVPALLPSEIAALQLATYGTAALWCISMGAGGTDGASGSVFDDDGIDLLFRLARAPHRSLASMGAAALAAAARDARQHGTILARATLLSVLETLVHSAVEVVAVSAVAIVASLAEQEMNREELVRRGVLALLRPILVQPTRFAHAPRMENFVLAAYMLLSEHVSNDAIRIENTSGASESWWANGEVEWSSAAEPPGTHRLEIDTSATADDYTAADDAASGECEAADVGMEADDNIDHTTKVLELNREMCDVVAEIFSRTPQRKSMLYTATMVWLLSRSTRNRQQLARARLTRALMQSIVEFWPFVGSDATATLLVVERQLHERLLAALWILLYETTAVEHLLEPLAVDETESGAHVVGVDNITAARSARSHGGMGLLLTLFGASEAHCFAPLRYITLSCIWVAGAHSIPSREAALSAGAQALRPLLVAAHDERQPASLRLRATAALHCLLFTNIDNPVVEADADRAAQSGAPAVEPKPVFDIDVDAKLPRSMAATTASSGGSLTARRKTGGAGAPEYKAQLRASVRDEFEIMLKSVYTATYRRALVEDSAPSGVSEYGAVSAESVTSPDTMARSLGVSSAERGFLLSLLLLLETELLDALRYATSVLSVLSVVRRKRHALVALGAVPALLELCRNYTPGKMRSSGAWHVFRINVQSEQWTSRDGRDAPSADPNALAPDGDGAWLGGAWFDADDEAVEAEAQGIVCRALHVLLNLSAVAKFQGTIGKLGLPTLLRLACRTPPSSPQAADMQGFASAIIANLERNSENRTRIYRCKLKFFCKDGQADGIGAAPRKWVPPGGAPESPRAAEPAPPTQASPCDPSAAQEQVLPEQTTINSARSTFEQWLKQAFPSSALSNHPTNSASGVGMPGKASPPETTHKTRLNSAHSRPAAPRRAAVPTSGPPTAVSNLKRKMAAGGAWWNRSPDQQRASRASLASPSPRAETARHAPTTMMGSSAAVALMAGSGSAVPESALEVIAAHGGGRASTIRSRVPVPTGGSVGNNARTLITELDSPPDSPRAASASGDLVSPPRPSSLPPSRGRPRDRSRSFTPGTATRLLSVQPQDPWGPRIATTLQRPLHETPGSSEITVQLAPVPNRVIFRKTTVPGNDDSRRLRWQQPLSRSKPPSQVDVMAQGDEMPKLALFPHVAGSRVACGLFESAYVHPDGSTVYYHFTPGSYEEGADYRNEPPSPPWQLTDICAAGLPPIPPSPSPISSADSDDGMPLPLRVAPRAPPTPRTHRLPRAENWPEGEMWGALPDAVPLRLEFLPKPRRAVTPDRGVPPPPKTPETWDFVRCNKTWRPRRRASDSRDYYDNDRVLLEAFAYDWSILLMKDNFRKLLQTRDQEKELADLKATLAKYYRFLYQVFRHYAALGCPATSDYTQMTLNGWTSLMSIDVTTVKDDSLHELNQSALDTVHIVSNLTPGLKKNTALCKVNLERAFMRFEFLEAVTRVALIKYVTTSSAPVASAPEALEQLLSIDVLPAVRKIPDVIHDVDAWRRKRLYSEATDDLLSAHKKPLEAIFTRYSPKTVEKGMMRKTHEMSLAEWLAFLDDLGWVSVEAGSGSLTFSERDATLLFVWARTVTVDEVKKRAEYLTLRFHDFLEALARVAETKALPRDDQLLAADSSDGFEGGASPTEYINLVRAEVQDDAGVPFTLDVAETCHGPHRRALAEKLEKLLEMMYFRLDEGGASLRANGRVTMEAADTKKFLKVMSQAAIKMETRRLERLQYEREALEAGREADDNDADWVAAEHPKDPSRTFYYHRITHETRWELPPTTARPKGRGGRS